MLMPTRKSDHADCRLHDARNSSLGGRTLALGPDWAAVKGLEVYRYSAVTINNCTKWPHVVLAVATEQPLHQPELCKWAFP